MLKVSDLSFSYTDEPLYRGVNFVVGKGQKVGLVGPNGSGKSTLLNILQGKEDGYVGRVSLTGTFALVPQEVKYDPDLEKSEDIRIYVDPDNKYPDHEIKRMFSGLDLQIKLDGSPEKLSGGQKTKLALARALLSKPDILLLDEPTNFMDEKGKRWVMNFLSDYKGAVIVISHDLELMDRAVDKVLAVNPSTKTIDEYRGNYTSYKKLKEEKEKLLEKQVLIKQKHIKRMEKGLQKMTRLSSAKGVRKRTLQRKKIEKEKEELPELPKEIRKIKIRLPLPERIGEIPLKANGVSKKYGNLKVLENLSFRILRNERIAFIGPNGSGKSTFIKILMGITHPDDGEVVRDEKLKVGYYSQEFEILDFDKSVIDTFTEATEKDSGFARAFLGRYMFLGDKVFQRIATLSGGEKTRLSIAILTGKNNNLLILDEPTTYLDVTSQRVILEALKDYSGSIIIVSHSSEFVREIKPDKVLLFPEGKSVYWDEELLERVEEV